MLVQTPTRPAHRDGNVLGWLGAYTTSVTGDVVYFLAISWAASRVAGPAQVGLVLAAGAVPRAVLMLAGGVLADRFGPRRIVLIADLVRCLVMGAATFLDPALWTLVAIALLFGAADAMFMPAVGALPPRLTDTGRLTRVQAMRSLAVRVSNAGGPLIAAAALATGSAAGFAVAAGLFAVSLVLLAFTRLRPTAEEPPTRPEAGRRTDLRDGLRHLLADRDLTRLVLVIGLGEMCFSGPVAAGLVLLTAERGWPAGVLGALLSGFSVGGAISGIALLGVGRFDRPGTVLALSLVVSAAMVAATGFVPVPAAAVICAGVLGLSGGVAMVAGAGELQARTDPRYLGRVTAVSTLATLGLSPLVLPLAGLVSGRWGAAWFFAGCAAVCLAASALALTISPGRR